MKPFVTSLIAALVGAALVVIGVLIVAVPAILLWMVSFQFVGDPLTFAGGVTGVWLLGHGVPLEFQFSAEAALGFGAAAEAVVLPLSMPLLGLTVVTVIGGVQAGWRALANERWAFPVLVASLVGFGVLTAVAFGFARPIVSAPAWYAVGRPVLIYALALAAGAIARGLTKLNFWARFVEAPLKKVGRTQLSGWIAASLRLTGAGVAAVVLIASAGVALSLAIHFTQIIAMSQSLHLDWIGAILVALAQILLLPVAILWGVSWLSGAGFAVGAGSSIGPFEQLVGPVPAFPMLGALPAGWGGGGLFAPLIIVIAAMVLGAWIGSKRPWRESPWWQSALAAICSGILVGGIFELLAGFSRGSIGPGRLIVAGPEPWTTGLLIAGEVTFGFVVGVLVRRLDQYWVNPLTESVRSRRTHARTTREEEWAKLGRPETFTHDLRRRAERDEEHELVSEFDTVEYDTNEYSTYESSTVENDTVAVDEASQDEQETGAIITDAFDFQQEKVENTPRDFEPDLELAAEADGDGELTEADDFETGQVERGEIDSTEWFDDFVEEEVAPEREIEAVEREETSDRSDDELTDPDAIARAFAWDAGRPKSANHADQDGEPAATKRPKRGWLRRKK